MEQSKQKESTDDNRKEEETASTLRESTRTRLRYLE